MKVRSYLTVLYLVMCAKSICQSSAGVCPKVNALGKEEGDVLEKFWHRNDTWGDPVNNGF